MDKRILELAVETLERRKADIEAEIAALQNQLGAKTPIAIPTAVIAPKGRKGRTLEQRKAHSLRMKKIWAGRKAKAGKSKTLKLVLLKAAPKAAANKARSEKMKAYWAERRAEKARK